MSGPADKFMPLYIGDYIADTMELSTLEHGAYLLLLFHYWRTSNPLPVGDEELARITRLSRSQWDSMSFRIRKFFRETEQNGEVVLTHKRVESEMARANGKYEASKSLSDKGHATRWAGARARKKGAHDPPCAKPHGMPTRPSPNGEGARENAPHEGGGVSLAKEMDEKLEKLRTQIGQDAVIWLSGVMVLEDDDGSFVVAVPKRVQVDKLKNVYWPQLDRALGEGKYRVEYQPPEPA